MASSGARFCFQMPRASRSRASTASASFRFKSAAAARSANRLARRVAVRANRRGVLGVPALLPQRLVVRRSSDGLRHPIRKCFAGLAVPSAQQHSRGDIAIRTFDGDIHGAVVRRRDQHGFPVEPRIGHRIHHQLRLAGAGRTGNDGQGFAPDPVEGRFLRSVARQWTGQRCSRRGLAAVLGSRSIATRKAAALSFQSVRRASVSSSSRRNPVCQLLEEKSRCTATIVGRHPNRRVVQPRFDITPATKRVRIEVGHDSDVESLGDMLHQSCQGSGISERQTVAHDHVDHFPRGHVEQFARHDGQIELRLGLRSANPLAVALFHAHGHQEHGRDDRMVLLVPRHQHRPSVIECGVALLRVLRGEMLCQSCRNGCPVPAAGDQMLGLGIVQITPCVQIAEGHQRGGRLGQDALAQVSAQARPRFLGAGRHASSRTVQTVYARPPRRGVILRAGFSQGPAAFLTPSPAARCRRPVASITNPQLLAAGGAITVVLQRDQSHVTGKLASSTPI